MKIFYIGNLELDVVSWEEIILSLITFADEIWLPYTAHFAKKYNDNILTYFQETLEILKDEGIIKTWSFQFQHENKKIEEIYKIHRLIYDEELNNINKMINDEFRRHISKVLPGSYGKHVELTSKFIDFRHDLLNIEIANLCETTGFVTRKSQNLNFLYNNKSLINQEYYNQLFDKFQVNNISTLNAYQIIQLRNLIERTKLEIDKLVQNKLIHINSIETVISEKVNSKFAEYHEHIYNIINMNIGKHKIFKNIINLAANTIGIFLWPVSFLPFIGEYHDQLLNKNINGFVTYMFELKKITSNNINKEIIL